MGHDQLVRSDSCLLGATTPSVEAFTYDGTLRLTGATRPAPDSLATTGGAFGSRSYGYDGRGNRTAFSDESAPWALTYSALHPDQLTQAAVSTAGKLLGRSQAYDVDGRVSSRTWPNSSYGTPVHQQTFTSFAGGAANTSALDTVFKAVSVNGAVYDYFYDALGRRRYKAYPGGTSDEYFYDTGHSLLVDRGSAALTPGTSRPVDDYVWLDGRPVVTVRGKLDSN